MKVIRTDRGFQVLAHDFYPPAKAPDGKPLETRLAQASSAIGDYEDSFDRPGSSFLWVGKDHHLNREEVAALVEHLQAWLKTGSLEIAGR